jgi:hypothetical protein
VSSLLCISLFSFFAAGDELISPCMCKGTQQFVLLRYDWYLPYNFHASFSQNTWYMFLLSFVNATYL